MVDDAVSDALARAAGEHWGRLVALVAAQFRRLDLAEDGVQEAFVAAARHWPRSGVPTNPPAWLLTAARRRVLDILRTEATAEKYAPRLIVDARTEAVAAAAAIPVGGTEIADERLRLLFTCCHPALPQSGSAALVLRLVAGLSVAEIARLFLVSETAMQARLTRVKHKIAAAGIPFALPDPEDLPARLDTVLAVIYLVFTEGYAATDGPDVMRTDLADEAIRLGRLTRRLLPDAAATRALLSLMLLQHSRREARVDASGRPILLPDQDRARWIRTEIDEGLGLLTGLDGVDLTPAAERYALQARIAAQHATPGAAADTDWPRIAALYERLEQLTASPVVRLNRAVAVAEADGPDAALALLDGLDTCLPDRHEVHLVRAELLARSGRPSDAVTAIELAIAHAGNEATRTFLGRRRAALSGDPPTPD